MAAPSETSGKAIKQQQSTGSTSGRISANSAASSENIKVAVRLRPFTEKERQRNSSRIIDIEQNTVLLHNPRSLESTSKKFTFDYSYWSHDGFKKGPSGVNVPDEAHANGSKYVGQERVFEDLGRFLLGNALKGYNSALLAYGQTGSGKSYTVSGYGANEGILPRFARTLFVELDERSAKREADSGGDADSAASVTRYTVHFSMIEIYNEVVRDLLSKGDSTAGEHAVLGRRGLKVREHPKQGFFVEHLTSIPCANKDEIERRIEEGQLNKSIASTNMNEASSRGHTIYEFRIKQFRGRPGGLAAGASLEAPAGAHETRGEQRAPGEDILTTSVVQLVDLAGSERMAVHITGQIGDDSFITSRSNSPYPRGTTSTEVVGGGGGAGAGGAATTTTTTTSTGLRLKTGIKSGSTRSAAPASSASSSSRRGLTQPADHHQRFKESVSINQSLSALGNCIQILSQYSQSQAGDSVGQLVGGAGAGGSTRAKAPPKIPYRDSVLTKLLNRCCLSGNSKVAIIATLSPAENNFDDTLSTLRFADRAKQIKTHATINEISRSEIVEALAREQERLKRMTNRSDDSSQTSNFDDTENIVENFTGARVRRDAATAVVDAMATPIRNRTRKSGTIDRTEGSAAAGAGAGAGSAAASQLARGAAAAAAAAAGRATGKSGSSSNLADPKRAKVLKELVQPAAHKLNNALRPAAGRTTSSSLRRSRSMGQRLAEQGRLDEHQEARFGDGLDLGPATLDENDLNDLVGVIQDGLMSPDSDESVSGGANNEHLSEAEQIGALNRMLSNSAIVREKMIHDHEERLSRTNSKQKSRKSTRPAMRQVSLQSAALKKTNPYLSNLNMDEQLTGVITYIIKQGVTVIGKSEDCDIVLHGPELRAQHARIERAEEAAAETASGQKSSSVVFIEPLGVEAPVDGKTVALLVNGSPVVARTPLKHCDRLLFGTNVYFVYVDHLLAAGAANAPKDANGLTELDRVTFDMARTEVLDKVMKERQNEAMIKEINDYTHRPGTGKLRRSVKNGAADRKDSKGKSKEDGVQEARGKSTPLKTTTTPSGRVSSSGQTTGAPPADLDKDAGGADLEDPQESNYREQLMNDTYEYAMPVAEVNAVAKELAIKVEYGLKILTGEEQLPEYDLANQHDFYSANDEPSSASQRDGTGSNQSSASSHPVSNQDQVTRLRRLDGLDIAPALFVKVSLQDLQMDFYWSKEKFQARRFKILELYGAWDVGGKSGLVEHLIEQSRTQGDFLIDPFLDDPRSINTLIGHAQINLRPISQLTDLRQTFDLLDLNDETIGTIDVHVIPCIANAKDKSTAFRPATDEELVKNMLSSPEELLGRDCPFQLKIIKCKGTFERYSNIFCQYKLKKNSEACVRTDVLAQDNRAPELTDVKSDKENPPNGPAEMSQPQELEFNHAHVICLEKVDQDILDFLKHGFLTIQLVGQYKTASDKALNSSSVITTIVKSINKYKDKLDQQSSISRMNYSNGFYSNNSGSANSQQGGMSSGVVPGISGPSSVTSTSATVNLSDQQNDDDEGSSSITGLPQENIIDMILTKRKLDRAENQLHYLKRTVNIAEHYNKKHIPVKIVKKLLNSHGQEVETGSFEEIAADVTVKKNQQTTKNSGCSVQ